MTVCVVVAGIGWALISLLIVAGLMWVAGRNE